MWWLSGRRTNKRLLTATQNAKELHVSIDLLMAKNQMRRDKLAFDLEAIRAMLY